MQSLPLDPHLLGMMRAEEWYSKNISQPGRVIEPDNIADFTIRYGGRVSDNLSKGAAILWGGATLGLGWDAGEEITEGGRQAIDGAVDDNPEAVFSSGHARSGGYATRKTEAK